MSFSINQERRRKSYKLQFNSELNAHSLNPYEGQSSKPSPPLMLLTVGLLLSLSLQSRCKIRWLAHLTHHTRTQHLSYRHCSCRCNSAILSQSYHLRSTLNAIHPGYLYNHYYIQVCIQMLHSHQAPPHLRISHSLVYTQDLRCSTVIKPYFKYYASRDSR